MLFNHLSDYPLVFLEVSIELLETNLVEATYESLYVIVQPLKCIYRR